MDRQAIEKLVQRWTQEGIVEGRLEVFDELLAADVVDRSGPGALTGVASFKARTAAVRAAFAQIELVVDDLVIGEGAIAWRWALVGTHVGAFAGVAATGRRVTLRGVNFQRLRAGKVIEHWTLADLAGAVQAMKG